MKTHSYLLAIVMILVPPAEAILAQGQVLARHFGATNPANEAFNLTQYGSPLLHPVTNDLGKDAWSIGVDVADGADGANYFQSLTSQQQTNISGADLLLNVTLRIIESPDAPSFGIAALFTTGTAEFILLFGMQPDGDPIVQAGRSSLSPVYVLEGAGSTYHTYQLVHDAQTGKAALWVDGQIQITGVAGRTIQSPPRIAWGDFQQPDSIRANWNLVSLEIVPEPSVVALFLLSASLLGWRWHRTRLRRAVISMERRA